MSIEIKSDILAKELNQGIVPLGVPKAYQYDAALVEAARAAVNQGIDDVAEAGDAAKAAVEAQGTASVNAVSAQEQASKADVNALGDKILAQMKHGYGYPFIAATAAAMADTAKIYVYTGSETGYTNGNWYYWNGTAWTSGGVYNATALETDKTLTISGAAADAHSVGSIFIEKISVSWTKDGHIDNTGNVSPNDVFSHTDYIQCDMYSSLLLNISGFSSEYAGLCFYTQEKHMIEYRAFSESNGSVINVPVPLNAKYFRSTAVDTENAFIKGSFVSPVTATISHSVDLDGELDLLKDIDDYTRGYLHNGVISKVYPDTGNVIIDWATTDYIPVPMGEKLYLKFDDVPNAGVFISEYDSSKGYLGNQNTDVSAIVKDKRILIPQNSATRYVRISLDVNSTKLISLVPYSNGVKKLSVAMQNDIPSGKTTFARKNVLDSKHLIKGYYCGGAKDTIFTDYINTLPSLIWWTAMIEPVTLKKGETLTVKTNAAIFYNMVVDDIIIKTDAPSPTNGYVTITNNRNINVKVYLSFDEGVHGDYLPTAYVGSKPTDDGYTLLQTDNAMLSNEYVYNALVNTSQKDTTANYTANQFVYLAVPTTANKKLSKIGITSATARTAVIAVGLVDQRAWFVASDTYNVSLAAGDNVIDLTSRNIVVPSGYCVAVNVTTSDKYIQGTGYRIASSYGQFASLDSITTSTFNGTPLFVPIFEDTDAVSTDTTNKIAEVSSKLDSIVYSGTILSTPDGTKYRLALDSSLNIIKNRVIPLKYYALGNSITYHGIKSDVGWYSEWGMAASKQMYDYVHRLSSAFKSYDSNSELTGVFNFATWEVSNDRDSTLSTLNSKLSSDLDLVTIQLGENASDTTTLGEDFEHLISYIRTLCPNAYVVMIGDCFSSASKDAIKKEVCSRMNVPFVDISAYSGMASFKAGMGTTIYRADGTTYTVTNNGVANHPGDEGMRLIAQQTLRVVMGDSSITI